MSKTTPRKKGAAKRGGGAAKGGSGGRRVAPPIKTAARGSAQEPRADELLKEQMAALAEAEAEGEERSQQAATVSIRGRAGEPLPTGQAAADAAVSLGSVGEPIPRQDGFQPTTAGWVARIAVLAGIASLVLFFPLSQPGSDVQLFSKAVTYAVIGLSLNVLIGYTGQISLGHQAFVGIGSFVSAYMVSQAEAPFLVAVIVAMVVGGLQAGILGLVSLRVRGLYFALVTLSYGLFAEKTLFKIDNLTGGAAGQNAARPAGFVSEHRYYFLCLAFLALLLWVDYRLMSTKGGRALLALRENPRVAATFGVNVTMFTLFAFVMSGVFAGLGGALLAHLNTQVSAEGFNFQLALIFIIMTVVGGLKSRPGIVIGSAMFAMIGYLIENIPGVQTFLNWLPGPPLTPGAAALVLGPLLLLLTLTLFPGGIGQQIRPITQWLLGNKFDIKDRGLREVLVTDVRA